MSFPASSRKGGDLVKREMSHQHREFINSEHAEADARAKCHRPCKCCTTIMCRELGKLVLELDEAIVGRKLVAPLIATQLNVLNHRPPEQVKIPQSSLNTAWPLLRVSPEMKRR